MKVTFEQEYIRCGKPSCGTCGQGAQGHGPYWYGYASINGKTKKKYFGAKKPSQADAQTKFTSAKGSKAKPGAKEREAEREAPRAEQRDRTYSRPTDPRFHWAQKMSRSSAMRILGLEEGFTKAAMKAAYRALVQEYHPDKARNAAQAAEYTEILKAVNVAYDYLGRVHA